MRLLATSLVVLAAAAPVGAAAAATETAAVSPQLEIEKVQPLVVSGRGFHPSERITLRVSGGNVPRLVRANVNGSFRIRLGSLRMFRCGAFIVVATGAAGQVASAHLPRPACISQHVPAATP